jgi:hypothetical protein
MDNKALIAEEVRLQISAMRAEIKMEIREMIRAELGNVSTKLNAKIDATCVKLREVNQNNSQIVPVKTQELAIVEENITKSVMKKISAKYDPQISKVVSYCAYQFQDTDELVSDYRKAVVKSDRDNECKSLTNGGDTRHIISEYVSTVFTENDGVNWRS